MAGTNGAFLPLLPAPPRPGTGWTVRVLPESQWLAHAKGQPTAALTAIGQYAELVWSPAVSDVGAGSITLDLGSPLWRTPLSDGSSPDLLWQREQLWCVYEDGALRGEFLGQKISYTVLDPAGESRRAIVISGPGGGQLLDRATVMSPYYPGKAPAGKWNAYRYTNVPVMAAWLALLRDAQKRGTAQPVQAVFTAARDTGHQPWEDTPAKRPATTATALLAGDVLFNYDSFVLTAAGQAAVAAVVAKIAKVPYPRVIVVGHADSTGTAAYNMTLSLNRAYAVRDAILALRQFAQVDTYAKGETQPRATNATAAGRARNRRVHVTYQSLPYPTDTVYEPPKGATLLKLLQDLTGGQQATSRGPIHCEWQVWPRFRLHVRGMLGRPWPTVRFYDKSTHTASKTRDRAYDQIRNLVAVQSNAGDYVIAASAPSRARFGQREEWLHLDATVSKQVHSQIAKTTLELKAVEDESWTMKVSATAPGRRPFRDYHIGDWIGVVRDNGAAPATVDKQRVMAITVRISDGRVDCELKLQTARQSRAAYLQAQIDNLIANKRGIRLIVQDEVPADGELWTPLTNLT